MQTPEVTVDAVEQNENNPVAETAAPERKVRPQVEVTDEMIEKSSKTLSTMLDFLGLDGTVKAEKRPSKINLIISSEDAGRIIGRKGQSLESLQLLLNRMMQNGAEDFPKIYIDIDGYSSSNVRGGNERRSSRGGGRRGGVCRGRLAAGCAMAADAGLKTMTRMTFSGSRLLMPPRKSVAGANLSLCPR